MSYELTGPADEKLIREALRQVMERNTTFCLVASDGISERIFYFAIGGIRVIGSGSRSSPTIAQSLLARGAIDLETHGKIMALVKNDERRFAEAAAQNGFVSAEEMQAAIVEQVQEEILDLFFWEGSELILTEGQPPKSFYEGRFQTAHLACNVSALLGEVLERADAWRDTVPRLPTAREVYEVTERGVADPSGPWARFLGLLDGTRPASDAIERSGARRVPAYEFLMVALRDGRVRRNVGGAAQRATREMLVREIEQLEAALKGRVEATIVRVRLARTLEQAGENARAAQSWRALGDQARRVNELDRALKSYAEAVRVLPTDFATRELIIEIYRHKQEWAQVVANGRPLADLFIKHNLLNRAKHLVLQLVGLEPNDVTLRRLLVFVLIGLGERDLALRHLRELAKILEAKNAPAAELRDCYVRILALDPRDKHARKRFEEISGIAGQRRIVRATLAVTGVALAALAAFYVYENEARRFVNEAVHAARQQVMDRDLEGATKTLEAASSKFGLSSSSKRIAAMLREVARIQREQIERAKRREEAIAAAGGVTSGTLRDEKAATALRADAKRFLDDGKLPEAHRILTELLRLHPETDAARDASFPMSLDILPRDARVLVNGTLQGHGSVVIQYCPSAKTVLEVEADGFPARRIVLEGMQPPTLSLSLHRPVRWTFALDAACEAAPLVTERAVFVAGRDRFLTAISAADGAALWRVPLGLYGDTAMSPVAFGKLIVVTTAQGELLAVESDSGELKWRIPVPGSDLPVAAGTAAPAEGQPAVAGDLLLLPSRSGGLHAVASDGTLRWSLPPKTLVAGGAAALLDETTFGVIDPKGSLVAYSIAEGKPVHRAPTSAVLRGVPAVAAAGDRLWAYAEDESLRLFSASSGAALRRFPMPRPVWEGAPAVTADAAFAVGLDGSVASFRATGETAFRRRLDEVPSASCATDGGIVAVPGSKGKLTILDATAGEVLWTFDAGSRISARPALGHGGIAVVTAVGGLHFLER